MNTTEVKVSCGCGALKGTHRVERVQRHDPTRIVMAAVWEVTGAWFNSTTTAAGSLPICLKCESPAMDSEGMDKAKRDREAAAAIDAANAGTEAPRKGGIFPRKQ